MCGRTIVVDGRPDFLNLNEGHLCGLVALAIKSGAFCDGAKDFIFKGSECHYEGPNHMGMCFADWHLKRLEIAKDEK